ncbi:MAG: XrtA/PEP-CTERM system exopolysaccharide export protein [Alcanivoracaceae bacterium]
MFIRNMVVALLVVVLAGCAAVVPTSKNSAAGFGKSGLVISDDGDVYQQGDVSPMAAFALTDEYRIGVDDRVMVSVWGNDNLSITVPVRPDGRISVPLIGDVIAGGRTPSEVASVVETALRNYVRDPKVSVILLELRSHEFISRVRITGAVRSPLSVPYRQGMTVLDLVLLAGGPNEFAAPSRSRLYRREAGSTGKSTALRVALDDILRQGKMATNYPLLPGDVITVPERLF